MPSPGDETNLVPNLMTIGNLPDHGAGAKLGYDATTKRFYVHKGDLLQGVRRTVSGDSVLNDKSFGIPVREVFAAAISRAWGDESMASRITSALRGLEFLRDTTYAGDDDKVRTVKGVIDDALFGFRLESRGGVRFRARYRKFLVYGFSQGMFVDISQGVCHGFALDWARRVLLANKPSYAHSKHRVSGVPDPPLTLNRTEKIRMMKKVAGRIGPLQEAYGRRRASEETYSVADNPLHSRLMVTEVWETVRFDVKEPGHLVMGKILESARNAGMNDGVFLLEFGGGLSAGHTVACRLLPKDAVHFFDPNIGEFLFPLGSSKPQSVFWDDWWQGLYRIPADVKRGDYYTECCVRGVVRDDAGQGFAVRRGDRRRNAIEDDAGQRFAVRGDRRRNAIEDEDYV